MSSQFQSDPSKNLSKTDIPKILPEEKSRGRLSATQNKTNTLTPNGGGKQSNPTRFYRNDPSPFLNEIRNIDEDLRRSAIGHHKLEFPSRKTGNTKNRLNVDNLIHDFQSGSMITGGDPAMPEMELLPPKRKHILPPLNSDREIKDAMELIKMVSCFTPEETDRTQAAQTPAPVDHSGVFSTICTSEQTVSQHEPQVEPSSTQEESGISENQDWSLETDKLSVLLEDQPDSVMNRTFQLPEIIAEMQRKFPDEFEQLTTCLDNVWKWERQSTIAFYGMEPQAGCSTILLAMAYGLSRKGRKVSVIDVDFKAPTLKDLLKICPILGWTELLQDDFPVDQVVYTMEHIRFFPLLSSSRLEFPVGKPEKISESTDLTRTKPDVLTDYGIRDIYPSCQNMEHSELCRKIQQTFQTNCEDSDLIFLDCGSLLPPQGEITMGMMEFFQSDGILFVNRAGRQPNLLDLCAFDRELQSHTITNLGVVENFFVPNHKKAA